MSRTSWLKSNRGFGYIEIFIVFGISLFLFAKLVNVFYKKRVSFDKNTQTNVAEQKINTTDYSTIINSTQQKVNDINTMQQDRINQFKKDAGDSYDAR